MRPTGPKKLPYGEGVPRHWNCRSTEIPVTRTWEELGIEGLGETREVVKRGERASMFGPTKHRTFDSWLNSRSAEEQDDILGSKRLGDAFRKGTLSTKQLVNAATGKPLLMRDLEAMGLIAPRYAPKPYGEYRTLDALRKAIEEEARNPGPELLELRQNVEDLEAEYSEVSSMIGDHYAGVFPLSDEDLAAAKARREELRLLRHQAAHEEKIYLAKKYLWPITEGRTDLTYKVDKGYKGVKGQAVEQGVDAFCQLMGGHCHLGGEFGEGDTYWDDQETFEHDNWADKHLSKRGPIQVHFDDQQVNSSDHLGGGAFHRIRTGDPDANDVIHELGHAFESSSSALIEHVNAYIESRVGEPYQWGHPDQHPHLHRPSPFKSYYPKPSTGYVYEYQGVVYGWDHHRPAATEFLSVGLEYLSYHTVQLLREDPETFDFLVETLRRRWDTP